MRCSHRSCCTRRCSSVSGCSSGARPVEPLCAPLVARLMEPPGRRRPRHPRSPPPSRKRSPRNRRGPSRRRGSKARSEAGANASAEPASGATRSRAQWNAATAAAGPVPAPPVAATAPQPASPSAALAPAAGRRRSHYLALNTGCSSSTRRGPQALSAVARENNWEGVVAMRMAVSARRPPLSVTQDFGLRGDRSAGDGDVPPGRARGAGAPRGDARRPVWR